MSSVHGLHYSEILGQVYEDQKARLNDVLEPRPTPETGEDTAPDTRSDRSSSVAEIDKSMLALSAPRRVRDKAHLQFVGSLPCLVCGRSPAHAHHLRFAQLRAMGAKVSDEWTVPLCPIHHRSLHDVGIEEEWWQAKGIDAKAEAEKLWRQRQDPVPAPVPMDEQQRPVPINLSTDRPRLG